MSLENRVGFVVKSDRHFFEGMCATLASIKFWYPDTPLTIIDCGLTLRQRSSLEECQLGTILKPDLSRYRVAEGSEDYYTAAVFGALECLTELFDLTVHIDADAILLSKIDELFNEEVWAHGLAATPDHPPLGLDFQIGGSVEVERIVRIHVPNFDPNSTTFNGGVYAIRKSYFAERLMPLISELIAAGVSLWGNEMALMNLAAFAANPLTPFLKLPQVYNHRPFYRRAPTLLPAKSLTVTPEAFPQLVGHFGEIKILHFVGREKPWQSDTLPVDCQLAWDFYRQRAREHHGLG